MAVSQAARLVIIDDEKYIGQIIDEALVNEDYAVTTFSDPREALEYIQSNKVDLVLTDLVMGEYSGVQMLDTTLSNHHDAIVILMTAHPTVQVAISVLKRGAYDFLVKPFKLELLKATIKRGLAHQKVIRENLQLKGQVQFLKVANSGSGASDLENYLAALVHAGLQALEPEDAGGDEVFIPSASLDVLVEVVARGHPGLEDDPRRLAGADLFRDGVQSARGAQGVLDVGGRAFGRGNDVAFGERSAVVELQSLPRDRHEKSPV